MRLFCQSILVPEFLQNRPLTLHHGTLKGVLSRSCEGPSLRVLTPTPVRTQTHWTCNTLPGPGGITPDAPGLSLFWSIPDAAMDSRFRRTESQAQPDLH